MLINSIVHALKYLMLWYITNNSIHFVEQELH